MMKRICLYCGKEFSDVNWKMKKRKYCSKKCYFITRIGVPLSKEHRERIGEWHKGKIQTEETRLKISKTRTERDYSGERNGMWKGGRSLHGDGYWQIRVKGIKRYQLEHRVVMEKLLGRSLSKSEIVHHIDWDRKNNDIENLYLFSSFKEHMKTIMDWRIIIKELLGMGVVKFKDGRYFIEKETKGI